MPAIEPFLRKLDAAAQHHAALVALTDPPPVALAPFWRQVHGEERLRLPCRAELLAVLRELGVEPEVIPIGPAPVLPLGAPDAALGLLRYRLVVGPGTAATSACAAPSSSLAEERADCSGPRGAASNGRSLLRWAPGRLAPTPATAADR